MDVIQSYFVNTETHNGTRASSELVSSQAMLSCKFLKKYGYTTVLYTSKDLLPKFKNHPYDAIITLDPSEYEYVTKNHFWSGTKLVCCEKHNNPYVHIDTDVFFIEDVLSDHINNNVLFLHEEPWVLKNLKIDKSLCKDKFNVQLCNSHNGGVFGGTNHQVLKNNLRIILDYIKNKSSDINDIIKEDIKIPYNDWVFSVFVEQVLLPSNLLKDIDKISTMIDTSECKTPGDVFTVLRKNRIIHFWFTKSVLHGVIGINSLIDYMTKYYF